MQKTNDIQHLHKGLGLRKQYIYIYTYIYICKHIYTVWKKSIHESRNDWVKKNNNIVYGNAGIMNHPQNVFERLPRGSSTAHQVVDDSLMRSEKKEDAWCNDILGLSVARRVWICMASSSRCG